MLTNEDIYTGVTDPSPTVNPKIIGAFYINTQTAKLFVCTDNTINRNVWKICNPDVEIPEMPEIPIPKFKTSVITTMNPFNYIMEDTWYHNTTDEIWFISSNSTDMYGMVSVADPSDPFADSGLLQDPEKNCIFENHWSVTVVVPKGYKFKIDFRGRDKANSLQWTRLSLSEITLPISQLDPNFHLYQYIDRLKAQIQPMADVLPIDLPQKRS